MKMSYHFIINYVTSLKLFLIQQDIVGRNFLPCRLNKLMD